MDPKFNLSGIFIRQGDRHTRTCEGRAEVGEMHLQASKCRGFLETTGRWEGTLVQLLLQRAHKVQILPTP